MYRSRGAIYVRVTLMKGLRPSFRLPDGISMEQAEGRKGKLVELAARFRAAGLTEQAMKFLENAAVANARELEALESLARRLCRGELQVVAGRPGGAPKPATFGEVAEQWTSGAIASRFPDRVQQKENAPKDAGLLRKHVLPIVGNIPVADFSIEHAETVMRSLPEGKEASSRRQIGLLMTRVLGLAADPLRLIKTSPIPRGFFRRPLKAKALGYLYPDEDARLLASSTVPLRTRVYYGFLDREGCRPEEAAKFVWREIDLDRGAVTLDVNKTDDPRAWALSPGTVRALRAWRYSQAAELAPVGPDDLVFGDHGMPVPLKHRAENLRSHLRAAGVTRAALFERSEARRPIRVHDLRATFITIALANGKTEAWVADRTGHRSSAMINKYRRAARTVAELGLGELAPLDQAIPELAGNVAAKGGGVNAERNQLDTKRLNRRGRNTRRGSSRDTAGDTPQDPSPGPIVANSREIGVGRSTGSASLAAGADASRSPADVSRGDRRGLLRVLTEQLAAAIEVGDLGAARVAHAALGELLGSAHGRAADVIDLADERGRRGGGR
jgi:integrase